MEGVYKVETELETAAALSVIAEHGNDGCRGKERELYAAETYQIFGYAPEHGGGSLERAAAPREPQHDDEQQTHEAVIRAGLEYRRGGDSREEEQQRPDTPGSFRG